MIIVLKPHASPDQVRLGPDLEEEDEARLPDTAAGTLVFTDVDLTNTHTVTNSLETTTWSGGGTLPAGLATTLASALTTGVATDSTHSEVRWK